MEMKKHICSYKNTNFICYTREYTLQLLKQGNSIIRFGDGEFSLLNHKNLRVWKQECTPQLRQNLINSFQKCYNNPNIIFCLYIDGGQNNYRTFKKKIIDTLQKRNKNIVYHDALIFKSFKDINMIKEIINLFNNKHIVIIHYSDKNKVYKHYTNNCKSVNYIICDKYSCYDQYDDLLQKSLKYNINTLFLLSCGPTAKILGLELITYGYRVIDIGGFYYNKMANIDKLK